MGLPKPCKTYSYKLYWYSMKIKEQTRKLAVGCSKHCFEVVDETDEVSSKHCFEVADRTDEVSNIYIRQGEVDVVWRDFRRVWPACKLVFVFFSQSHQPLNRLFYLLPPKPWKRFFTIYFTYKYKRARHTRLYWKINPIPWSLFSTNIKEDSYESCCCKSRKHWCCCWRKSTPSTWNWRSTCRNWILLCLPHW